MSNHVQAIDVSAHHGTLLALDGIDCTFPAGAVTALTGGNGSGKSTLVSVIAGVHRATRGAVQKPTGGVALMRQSWSSERPLPLAVAAVVAMGRWRDRGHWRRLHDRDRTIVAEALEQLDITDLAHRQLGALSGGQRQRVLMAQAVTQQAPVLLLDEPAAGVDADAQKCIEDAMLAAAHRGTIVVHVTHDPGSIQRADHHVHLEAGRVAGMSPLPRTAGMG